MSNNTLALVAQPTAIDGQTSNGQPKTYFCRSGMVTTYKSLSFEYGYVKITARLPSELWMWPALWLAASNLQWPPEIDMMEHWGLAGGTTGVFLHPVTNNPTLRLSGVGTWVKTTTDLTQGWHTFSIYWTPAEIIWYIDGHKVFSLTNGIPHQPMYLIMNLAYWPSAPFPQGQPQVPANVTCAGQFLIRSVQVWQQ
ncbi:MAG: glycoside hydrolase family 16 protein [Streptosporangiaceae bacterium]